MSNRPSDSARATELVKEVVPLLNAWAQGPHGSATPLRAAQDELLTELGDLLNTLLSRVIDDSLGNDWPGYIIRAAREG